MSFYLVCTGIGDQIGGQFLMPPSIIHIPRFQGDNVTLPPGLNVKGGRAFEWALLDPIPPGVTAILNKNSSTPTVVFDLNTYAGGSVVLKCFAIGNPSFFRSYLLNTNLFSSLGLGLKVDNEYPLTPNSVQPINVQVVTENSSNAIALEDINYTGNYILEWGDTGVNQQFLKGYRVEGWNPVTNSWVLLANTNSTTTTLGITNPSTTYRVTSFFTNDVAEAQYPKSSQTLNKTDRLVLTRDPLKLLFDSFSFVYLINQSPSTSTFYTEISTLQYPESLPLRWEVSTLLPNLSSTSTFTFYSELVTYSSDEPLPLRFITLATNLEINQTPTGSQFWAVLTGV